MVNTGHSNDSTSTAHRKQEITTWQNLLALHGPCNTDLLTKSKTYFHQWKKRREKRKDKAVLDMIAMGRAHIRLKAIPLSQRPLDASGKPYRVEQWCEEVAGVTRSWTARGARFARVVDARLALRESPLPEEWLGVGPDHIAKKLLVDEEVRLGLKKPRKPKPEKSPVEKVTRKAHQTLDEVAGIEDDDARRKLLEAMQERIAEMLADEPDPEPEEEEEEEEEEVTPEPAPTKKKAKLDPMPTGEYPMGLSLTEYRDLLSDEHFGGRFTGDLDVVWSPRMKVAAGYCHGSTFGTHITLNPRLLRDAPGVSPEELHRRLVLTLAHEMTHAWQIYSPGLSRSDRKWHSPAFHAKMTEITGVEMNHRCHSYDTTHVRPWKAVCVPCGVDYGLCARRGSYYCKCCKADITYTENPLYMPPPKE